MLEKAPVFRRNKRMHNMPWQILIGNQYAPALTDLGYQVPVATVYPERDLQRDIPDRVGLRKSGRDEIIRTDYSSDAPDAAAGTQSKEQNKTSEQSSSTTVTWILVCFR